MQTVPRPNRVSPFGHSADVELRLHAGGEVLSLTQTGPDAVRLKDDIAVPAGPAKVEVIVDGQSHMSEIVIVGSQRDTRWLAIISV